MLLQKYNMFPLTVIVNNLLNIYFVFQAACNSSPILALCELHSEPEFKQVADIDTPSGNFESKEDVREEQGDVREEQEVIQGALSVSSAPSIGQPSISQGEIMSSSSADVDLSVLNISDISAISVPNKSSMLTYSCKECDMVCRTRGALQKHKVFCVHVELYFQCFCTICNIVFSMFLYHWGGVVNHWNWPL